MQLIPQSVNRLIEEFSKLPSIGPRTAERLTFFLLRGDETAAQSLGQALLGLREGIKQCQTCFNLAESDVCGICSHPGRDAAVIAVVEEPLDVVAIEKTGLFQGLYHVLGGVISPLDGIGPDQLQIKSLFDRVAAGGVTEIILATNPVTEGEATAMYIRKQLEGRPVRLTRLARGLPVGGDLEYADQITLGRALQGRQTF
ncbi:MAG TPA: recombination mediator RecR [Candidatus Saccharimonadales bacterium]|nr:recombination mediator RecR [Candidatus Saccharimonadales bacterium]